MAQHIYRDILASAFARSSDGSVASRWTDPTPATYVVHRASNYRNPPVFFPENQPSTVNSSANWGAEDGTTAQQRYAAQDFAANAGMNSNTGHTNPTAMYDGDEDDEEISSQPLLPYVGMEFDSLDDAKAIYNEYAFKMGFGIHIGASRNSQKKGPTTLIKRVFQCVHTGKPGSTGDSSSASEGISMGTASSSKSNWFERDVTNKRQKNRLLRHDCKAKMIVGLKGAKWIVSHFVAEHTHPLMPQPELVRYYRSHRSIPQEDMDLIMTMHDVNFSTSSCMGLLGRVHGGDRRILPYVKRDVSNVRSKLRQTLNLRDMDLTVEYFKRRVAENPQFYYEKIVDDETNSVTGLFWVDGRTRALYPKYKDCVFFDTTFCTNRYNMPFAPIVGVNNHLQTVLLGCALLPNEQIETFKWVFQNILLAMNNEHPLNIMTDQDKAMEIAIAQVLPNTVHRCCKWHVQRKAREKLGRIMSRDENFEQAFYTCINDSDTVAEFEENWQHMIHCFDLVENRHLCNMWRTRHTWAPAFFRKCFFPFTSTTGRSEGLNSYFKTFVNPQDSVWRFVQQYEMLQETMLDREDNQAFIGAATTAPLYSRYTIERQAVGFYTRSVFGRFQTEVTASTGFLLNQVPSLGNGGMQFELFSNYYEDPKIFIVNVDMAQQIFECSCNCFEMNGIICAHIVRVMIHLNVQAIPQRYLLERWSERATTPTGSSPHLLDFALPSNNTLKYNSLCRKFTWLASQACSNDVAYKILSDAAYTLEPIIAAARRGEMQEQHGDEQQQQPQRHSTTQGGWQPATMHQQQKGQPHQQMHEQQQPKQSRQQQPNPPKQQQQAPNPPVTQDAEASAMLQNPSRVPNKGRPTEKARRRKTLLEQREDAAKKKARTEERKKEAKPRGKPGPKKKQIYNCSYCKEDGHNIQSCEQFKVAMAVQKCNYCSGDGHAIHNCHYLRAAMSIETNVARTT